MKQFMADWKNPALLAAGVLIALLLVLVFIYGSQSINARIVTVGDVRITRNDVLGEIKRNGGDQLLLKMIDDTLLENYARQKNITVTEADLQQVLKPDELRAAVGGMTLNQAMAKRNMTIEELRHEYTLGLLRMKLTIPEEEIKAVYADLVKKKELDNFPYTLPACYRYRSFIAPSKEKAKEMVDALQQPGTPKDKRIEAGATHSINPQSSTLLYYVDGTPPRDYPELLSQLPKLKPDQVSAPVEIDLGQLGMKGWAVVMLDSILPMQKPTLENCTVQIGLSLMQGEKYEQRLQTLKMEAVQKVEVTFTSDEFKLAYDTIQQLKRESFSIPGPQGSPLPGSGSSGLAGPQPAGPQPAGPKPAAPGGR
ncbi:MAG: peptidylprolyl isomerase [Armatimonadota bacterium]